MARIPVPSTSGVPRGALGNLANRPSYFIGRKTFQDIENLIEDSKASIGKVNIGLNALVRTMAYTMKGYAQQQSGGPVAPGRRSNPALANRIPVQRITGAYFAGWQVKSVGKARYRMFNESKEAYLIETGLYQRTRRPILKMSVLNMLQLLQTTRTGDRFASWVMAPRRDSKGQFQSFGARTAMWRANNSPSGAI